MIPTLQQGQVGRYIILPAVPTNVCADGPGWTAQTLPNAESLRCIAYGNGIFAAAGTKRSTGYQCAVWSDDDGVTWNESSTTFNTDSSYSFQPWSMGYGGGVWLAGMHAIYGWKSTDGKTWSRISNPAALRTFVYADSNFIAMKSSAGTNCYTTTDGTTFTSRTLPSSRAWGIVGTNGNTAIAVVTDNSMKTAVSTDGGATWSAGGDLPFSTLNYSVAYGNGVWVVTTNGSHVAFSTDDGATWNNCTTTLSNIPWMRVRFVQGRFLMISQGGTNYNSVDGDTWTATSSNDNMASFAIDWDADGLGAYAAIGEAGSDTTVANSGICTG